MNFSGCTPQAKPFTIEFHIPATPTRPEFFAQIGMFALSLRDLGPPYASAPIHVSLGYAEQIEIPDAYGLEQCREQLHWHVVGQDEFARKGMFAQGEQRFRLIGESEFVCMSDPDTLIIRGFDELLRELRSRPAVAGLVTHLPQFPRTPERSVRDWWDYTAQKLLGQTISFPCRHSFAQPDAADEATPFCANCGFVIAPGEIMRGLRDDFFTLRNALVDLFPAKAGQEPPQMYYYSAQIALALAVAKNNVPWKALPIRYNWPNDPAAVQLYPMEVPEIRVLHYLRSGEIDRRRIFTEPKAFKHLLGGTFSDLGNRLLQRRVQQLTRGVYLGPNELASSVVIHNNDESAALHAAASKRPAALPMPFVVGTPRSGTTLLRLMLDAHSDLAIPHETHFFFDLLELSAAETTNLESFYQKVVSHFSWSNFGIDPADFRRALAETETFTISNGLRAFYRLYARARGKTRWGEKTPDYAAIMPEIERLLPEAHFIHIIRDGRDVALSTRGLWFAPGDDFVTLAQSWKRRVELARQSGRRCANYMELRYEDVVSNPTEAVQAMCRFLDLSFEPSMLQYYENAAARLDEIKGWPSLGVTAAQLQALHPRVELPPQTDRVQRWKTELSLDDRTKFETVAGPTLRELGYETVSAARRSARRGQNEVTALLLADDLNDRAFQNFERLRKDVDEFVIFVDQENASGETLRRAKQLGTNVHEVEACGLPEIRQNMIESCETDWILRLDSDETLSPEWADGRWRELLRHGSISHFWFARRWLVEGGRHIVQAPWWPDWQMRLFRNIPEIVRCPGVLHQPAEVLGSAGYCKRLAIHHHTFKWLTRAEREGKVAKYQRFAPHDALGYYYLIEDYPVDLAVAQSGSFDPSDELLFMKPLESSECIKVSAEISQVPREANAGQLFWPLITIVNHANTGLTSGPPNPVHIAYHWVEERSGALVVFDGTRTALLPIIGPRETANRRVFVTAPTEPGRYILQISLVQEGIRWFEQVNPTLPRQVAVDVR